MPVIPLYGKKPATAHGVKDATLDEHQLNRWSWSYGKANIGVACSEMVVADFDLHKPEFQDQQLLKELQSCTPFAVNTGRGGVHLYFRGTTRNAVGILPGVDIKGVGGYVVAPPSKTVGIYAWAGKIPSHVDDLPPVPEILTELIEHYRVKKAEGIAVRASGGSAFLKIPELIPEGVRNRTLFEIGCRMRTFCYGRQDILNVLASVNLENCQYPLPDQEVLWIVQSVMRYAGGMSV